MTKQAVYPQIIPTILSFSLQDWQPTFMGTLPFDCNVLTFPSISNTSHSLHNLREWQLHPKFPWQWLENSLAANEWPQGSFYSTILLLRHNPAPVMPDGCLFCVSAYEPWTELDGRQAVTLNINIYIICTTTLVWLWVWKFSSLTEPKWSFMAI